MLTATLSALVLASTTAVTPLGPVQQARLAALLVWADAYRRCYQPEPFALTIDQRFTVDCVQRFLGEARHDGPADEQAAIAALVGETPRLVDTLNAPGAGSEPPAGGVPRPPAAASGGARAGSASAGMRSGR